jgi:predicted nucleic acid-binding protein
MRLVVADTGPLNYLVLTGYIELLPELFERVLAPQAVRDELADPEAPAPVRAWIAQTPAWLEVRPTPNTRLDESASPKLDEGELTAIALGLAVKADLILMDDQDGVTVARRQGLTVTGTLGCSISRRVAG